MNSDTITEKFDRLVNWVRTNGGYVNDALYLTGTNENRFISCKTDVTQNTKLLEIPDKCCITANTFAEIVQNCDETEKKIDTNKIIFALLYHISLGESSFYYPYISLLPKYEDYSYHPIYQYNDKKFAEWTKISKLFAVTVQTLIYQVDLIWQKLQASTVIPKEYMTHENVKWCYMIINSRQWSHGLVPIADLFQHSANSGMLLHTENNSSRLVTPININAGQIIYDSYGAHNDIKMLSSYGFVDDIQNKNLHRVVPLSLSLNEGTLAYEKLRYTYASEYINKHKTFVLSNKGITDNLKQLLRIASLSDTDLKLIDTKNNDWFTNKISLDNELLVYQTILKLVEVQRKDVTVEELTYAKEILKTYTLDSLEAKIALACIHYISVLNATVKYVIAEWNTLLKSPFSYTLTYNEIDKILSQ
uniref:SET domain-containing protein n=1 Tax=viral metagenome TaxID=1070528 RepID=A0A6C0E9P7_9ZZZZ